MQAILISFIHSIRMVICTKAFKQFLHQTFYLGALLSLSVYTWVRILLFHELSFNPVEEIILITRILFAGWGLAALCIGSFGLLLYVADHYNEVVRRMAHIKWKLVAMMAILLMGVSAGCNA